MTEITIWFWVGWAGRHDDGISPLLLHPVQSGLPLKGTDVVTHGGFNKKIIELNGDLSIWGYQALQHVTVAPARTGG